MYVKAVQKKSKYQNYTLGCALCTCNQSTYTAIGRVLEAVYNTSDTEASYTTRGSPFCHHNYSIKRGESDTEVHI